MVFSQPKHSSMRFLFFWLIGSSHASLDALGAPALHNSRLFQHPARVVTLQQASRLPISVYIDSNGGNIAAMESLWKLLKIANQDAADPCRIVTVVTTRAASAAADLLSSGDYAIALPHSTILYHGSRIFRDLPLTVETTSMLAHALRMTNETYAMELVRKIESRLMFRFLLSRGEFDGIRAKNRRKPLSDAECFLTHISGSLSNRAKKLFETARERAGRYEKLLEKVKRIRVSRNVAQTEAKRIKAVVDFEVESNKSNKDWTFHGGGLTRLQDDFFLLSEHLDSSQSDRLNRLCTQWGKFAISTAAAEEIERAPEADRDRLLIEKVRPLLEPLWAFFVALCHALQEGENELTATDAFWLGLIDEVMGERSLTSLRLIVEYRPDPPAPPAPAPAPPAPDLPVPDAGG
jgi:hypothetical protein